MKDLASYCKRGQFAEVAQFYELVGNGLIMAEHVFKGLERGLLADDREDADRAVLVYAWKPRYDVDWKGDGSTGGPFRFPPPSNRVFVTIVTPNVKHKEQFPDIEAWINKWNWIDEEARLPGAPVGWVDRYFKKLWSRK